MKRKISMLVVFIIGMTLLATSVLVSATSKTGYEILRDAVENTIYSSVNFKSVTLYQLITVSFDSNEVVRLEKTEMTDFVNDKGIVVSYEKMWDDENYRYVYDDPDKTVSTNNGQDYRLIKKIKNPDYEYYYDSYSPPVLTEYDKQSIKTVKKIADAAVATFNMQNVLAPSRDSNGGFKLSFSFNEGQLPPLINAVLSAMFIQNQYSYSYYYEDYSANYDDTVPPGDIIVEYNSADEMYLSQPLENIYSLKDLYIKYIGGEATVSKDNLVQKGYAAAEFTGVDVNGENHKIVIEILLEIKDIDSTVVNEPDLNGKNVKEEEPRTEDPGKPVFEPSIPEKDLARIRPLLGKYVSNIVEISGDKMIKTGEYYLELTEILENTGRVKVERYTMADGEKLKEKQIVLEISYYNFYEDIVVMHDTYGGMYEFHPSQGYAMVIEKKNLIFTKVFE